MLADDCLRALSTQGAKLDNYCQWRAERYGDAE